MAEIISKCKVQLMCRRSRQFFYKSNKSVVFRGDLWYNVPKDLFVLLWWWEMRKYLALSIMCMFVLPAFGAGRSMLGATNSAARPGLVTQQLMPTLSVAHGTNANGVVSGAVVGGANDNASGAVAVVDDEPKPVVNRDKERIACLSNNVGVGNTFVWASKNSNTSNYASMVEDVNNPENNVCFVLVGMRSEDSRINVSDVQPQYFQWGQNITCGAWTDEEKLEKRILDAKKTTRTLATIGGAVGGAGVGVGAMELFGNKLIGGAVMGQKQYDEGDVQWYQSKAAQLQKENADEYKIFADLVSELKTECGKANPDSKCKSAPYSELVQVDLSKIK